jgi:hypothetical protein
MRLDMFPVVSTEGYSIVKLTCSNVDNLRFEILGGWNYLLLIDTYIRKYISWEGSPCD